MDENRVVLTGNSDGCVALFFHAFRNPDPWCGYAGYVGSPDRLRRARLQPDGQMHLSNLKGQRFHLGYGRRDSKARWDHVERYMELFLEQGAFVDWFANDNQGHELRLTPEQSQRWTAFLEDTVRDPLPDSPLVGQRNYGPLRET